jgi:hypothetical protein
MHIYVYKHIGELLVGLRSAVVEKNTVHVFAGMKLSIYLYLNPYGRMYMY